MRLVRQYGLMIDAKDDGRGIRPDQSDIEEGIANPRPPFLVFQDDALLLDILDGVLEDFVVFPFADRGDRYLVPCVWRPFLRRVPMTIVDDVPRADLLERIEIPSSRFVDGR